ncbi:MAG: PDZ domain-containing protein [Acidobacteriota bacterium]|nr:PDZ domain-containing protein [Acidobacteriota bacterium]
MHQRTWLSLISLPLVATFTYPLLRQAPSKPAAEARAQDPLAGLADIQDVLGLVKDNYVDRPDMERVISGGIQAVLERAHPLNAYLTPEDLRLPDPGPADIGIRLVKRGIYAQVVAVRPGGPGDKAGIQVGDVVRKLDKESVGPLSAWSLERSLHGAVGTSITLLRYASSEAQIKTVSVTRELPIAAQISMKKSDKAQMVSIPDLSHGRAAELKALLSNLDRKLPLILDLRKCSEGELEEAAAVSGLFALGGPFVTIQEHGQADRIVEFKAAGEAPFAKVILLLGPSTLGPSEALASALKKAGDPVFGERTSGLGVERTRLLLRQGGAVELVTKRWIGAGGEKLDRAGIVPDHVLKGLKPDEDPIPKILAGLNDKPAPKDESQNAA